jgi:hypothetical protein
MTGGAHREGWRRRLTAREFAAKYITVNAQGERGGGDGWAARLAGPQGEEGGGERKKRFPPF